MCANSLSPVTRRTAAIAMWQETSRFRADLEALAWWGIFDRYGDSNAFAGPRGARNDTTDNRAATAQARRLHEWASADPYERVADDGDAVSGQ